MIGTDSLLEYVHVFGNYYGTPKKWVLECIEKGKDVLLEIEIVGAMKVKEKYPDAILVSSSSKKGIDKALNAIFETLFGEKL